MSYIKEKIVYEYQTYELLKDMVQLAEHNVSLLKGDLPLYSSDMHTGLMVGRQKGSTSTLAEFCNKEDKETFNIVLLPNFNMSSYFARKLGSFAYNTSAKSINFIHDFKGKVLPQESFRIFTDSVKMNEDSFLVIKEIIHELSPHHSFKGVIHVNPILF